MSTPDDQKILAYLKANPAPQLPKALNRALGGVREEINSFKRALRRLEDAGQIAFYPGLGFGLPGLKVEGHKPHQHNKKDSNKKKMPRIVNLVGVVEAGKDGRLFVKPCNKEDRQPIPVTYDGNPGKAKAGDVVMVEPIEGQSAVMPVRITKVLGRENDPGLFSLISLYEQGLATEFSKAALAQAQDPALMAIPAPDATRIDMRHIPLVTIDGADSRDFDDAVFAEETPDGFHLIVAIADVAHYVRPGDALDQDAFIRGNSTYFPDRVLPMLPQELSNGVCSLNPGVDRACLAFDMTINKAGNLQSYELKRGLMKSTARLTYEQVQAARDGTPDATTGPIMDIVINPLYAAYAALAKARAALDLDIPERKVTMSGTSTIESVKPYIRVDSHKLIEEFMILANEAADLSLENKGEVGVHRIHEPPPSLDKLENVREYAAGFGLIYEGDLSTLDGLREFLAEAKKLPYGDLIAGEVLRAQSKAVYSPEPKGHFGLAKKNYAHFTSPIRRYSDLVEHRLLISAFNKGAGGATDEERDNLVETCRHISGTERRSDLAERSAKERYATSYLSNHIGETLAGRISSITKAGLFVRLEGTGVTGLLPMRFLPNDRYDFSADQHALVGKSGRVYRAGADIPVTLKEADGLSGRVILKAANDNSADIPGTRFQSKPKTGGPKPG